MKNYVKQTIILALTAIITLAFVGCESNPPTNASINLQENTTDTTKIRVGSKDFTESLIVGEIYALALEDAGYIVERKFNIAGAVTHTSLINGEIDIYPEYTGTGLLSILQMDLITDPQEVYDIVKKEYKERFQLIWLDFSNLNDGQGLAIRTDVSKRLNIKNISDLQTHASELRFASQGEFDQREDGLPRLEKVYGSFNWKSTKVYDNALKYQVLSSNEADVMPAYTTEGQLSDTDQFTLLEDDKKAWPPYNLVPVLRNTVLEKNPKIADILNKISAELDTEKITALNAKVDIDKMEYEEVANEFFNTIR